jgi:hypothetical protein
MKPPWKKFPDIAAGSIGWRMGAGEGYYDQFYRWFSSLSPAEQDTYSRLNKPPFGWDKLYNTIREHPWR